MKTIIQIKVLPNAKKNQILGWQEGILRIKIRGIPEKGKANKALIAFLSEHLDIPSSQIQIISGHTAALKRIQIEGVPEQMLISMGLQHYKEQKGFSQTCKRRTDRSKSSNH